MSEGKSPQERVAAARQLYAALKEYLDRPTWTPAEGALILSGLRPLPGCTELPRTAFGLDDRPYKGDVVDRMIKAGEIMRVWEWRCEDDVAAPTLLEPSDFIQWCADSDIETEWMRLVYDILADGQAQVSQPDLIPLAVLDYASHAMDTLGAIQSVLTGREYLRPASGAPVAEPEEQRISPVAGPMPIPVNRDHVSTEELAAILNIQPQSIRKRYASNGSYHGIRPRKLPNRRLLWPVDEVRALLGENGE